jgi:hypothetical protein
MNVNAVLFAMIVGVVLYGTIFHESTSPTTLKQATPTPANWMATAHTNLHTAGQPRQATPGGPRRVMNPGTKTSRMNHNVTVR